MVKRSFDVLFSFIGLLALAPLLLIVSVLIAMQRDGPIFFIQERLGRHGMLFKLFKFRTMRPFGNQMESPEKRVTVGKDARITALGAVLRRAKLDELPQLWNVLKGDMSFVGPRPEAPEFLPCYPLDLKEIVLSVRPGITDRASIKYRNEAELLADEPDPIAYYETIILPDKLRIGAQYAQSQSFWEDMRIVLDTLIVVIRPNIAAGMSPGFDVRGRKR